MINPQDQAVASSRSGSILRPRHDRYDDRGTRHYRLCCGDELGTRRIILVVDDDARLRKLLARYLSDHGFLVTTAEDAADARGKLGSFAFDLIVLDLMMPGESGLVLGGRSAPPLRRADPDADGDGRAGGPDRRSRARAPTTTW